MRSVEEDSTIQAVDPATGMARRDEDGAIVAEARDNMPVESVVDVDEWVAEEAGYGYGV